MSESANILECDRNRDHFRNISECYVLDDMTFLVVARIRAIESYPSAKYVWQKL